MDRRQRKNRAAINAAFTELMLEKHYSQVTVAQIIERADIARSTFYAHFETKDDLLSSMGKEMFDHIFEGVNEYCVTHHELQTADLPGKLAHLLYHLRDTNSGIIGKLIDEGEPYFTKYFQQQLFVLIDSETNKPALTMPNDLYVSMLVSAFCQLVSWWIRNGSKEDPQQLAQWFAQFNLV